MKVFISWSGDRSRLLAQALHDWLPLVLHFVEPWISHADIEAGERWANEVARELEVSNFGIICVTRENISSPWILFEAGALAKSMQNGRVTPLLFDIEFKDISGPLAQFQAKKVEKDGFKEVIMSINRLSDSPVPEARLNQLFDMAWTKLDEAISALPKITQQSKHNRSQHEVLEDLVTGVRGIELRLRDSVDDGSRLRKRKSSVYPMLMEEIMHGVGLRDPIRYLLFGSLLKDALPWVYEIALDAYRSALEGNQRKKIESQERFSRVLHMLRRGPFLEEAGLDKMSYMMIREMEMMMSTETEEGSFKL